MTDLETRSFDNAYEGTPTWDIGRPQPAVVRLAEAGTIRGAVLDVGCGTGTHARFLAGLGHPVVGVDFSARAIERALAGAPTTARFEVGDVRALDAGRLGALLAASGPAGMSAVVAPPAPTVAGAAPHAPASARPVLAGADAPPTPAGMSAVGALPAPAGGGADTPPTPADASAPAATPEAPASPRVPGPPFDTVLDVGCFHTLQPHDRDVYARSVGAQLRPGGHLVLLAWSDRNRFGRGPARVTRREIRSTFRDEWTIEAIDPETLESLLPPGQVHAWLAVVRRTIPTTA